MSQAVECFPSSLGKTSLFKALGSISSTTKEKEEAGCQAHACNHSYSGGGDQEDHSSKAAWTKQFLRPYLEKKTSQKRAVEWLKL
jgi:hypothetical protein